MADNLLEMMSSALTPAATQNLARAVGESESAVKSGLGALLPVLLGGLAAKATTPSGSSSLWSTITGSNIDLAGAGGLAGLLSGDTGALTRQGSSLLGSLFGGASSDGIAGTLAGISGMQQSSASKLVLLGVPMVIGWLKKLIAERGLDLRGLVGLLAGQKSFLADKLDPRLTSAFGLGAPASLLAGLGDTLGAAGRSAAGAAGAVGAGAVAAADAGASGLRRWWPWIIAAIVALLLLMQLSRCGTTTEAPKSMPAAAPPPAAAPAAVVTLPAKVYFDTGKAEPNAEGSATLSAVTALLKSKPEQAVDLTGFTDKSGDAAANEELAKKRALAVKAALEGAGIAPDRIGTKPPVFVEVGAGTHDAEARRVDISPR
jgi:outer membrane protein OmpA-like peptidoglycan-associated protein